ncbi:MAG: DUF4838 domain-containing protein [Kiritimatiellae bacterium]|nr:DUF4838 domain-containing protein [Kiritimatiellia bacterium]
MKRQILLAAIASAVAWVSGAGETRLSEDGKTDYKIVVDEAAPPPVQFAAEELQTFLKESTGADFPIVSAATGPTIEVGTEKARAIVSAAYPRPFKVETSAVVTKDGTLAIWGAGEAGHAYGVYMFLERVIGCRWFTVMGENLVPKHPTLTVGDLSLIERPKLDYRMLLTFGGERDKDSKNHLFLFRNRINQQEGNFENVVRKDLNGKMPVRMRENRPNCHSFFKYMPPAKYFKNHPEYYTLSKEGKREARQLCFASKGLREELTKNFLAHAGKVGGKGFLDLSQEDAGGPMCHCAECCAMAEKYDSNGGPLFDYLIELAPIAKAKYPELVIHTLVYHRDSTQKPPKTERPFPDNIAVVFAPLDDDFSKPLDHPNNLVSLEHLRGWTKICKVWTWSYPAVYTVPRTVFANLARSAADVKIGIDAGLTGSYHEHDVGTDAGCNFADLQTWMLTQHFRFPDRDWRALRKEFCDFYYGAASAQVIAYEEYIERNVKAMDYYLTFLSRPDAYIKPKDIVRLQGDFDAMERAVGGDPVYVQRLREVRAGLDMLTLVKWKDVERHTSGLADGVDGVFDRAMDTRRKAIARRDTRMSAEDIEKKVMKGFGEQLKTARTMATLNVKPLPAIFDGIPEDKITQVIAQTGYINIEKVDMPDAAAGYAYVERKARHSVPFSIGFYDNIGKKYLLNSPIAAKDIVPNEFHFYKLGRCGIPSGYCVIWMGNSWRLSQSCAQIFRPGMDEDWDVYVSLKFEGPVYDKNSTLKESNVYYDRIVFVGPFPR